MSVSVTMPRLGESVSEGTVTRWLKKEGDQVEADEPLLEVSTDKVDTEIPSPAAGVLKAIKVGEDETVEVGSELAVIDDGGGEASADDAAQAGEAQSQPAAAGAEAAAGAPPAAGGGAREGGGDPPPAEPEPHKESAEDAGAQRTPEASGDD